MIIFLNLFKSVLIINYAFPGSYGLTEGDVIRKFIVKALNVWKVVSVQKLFQRVLDSVNMTIHTYSSCSSAVSVHHLP